MSMPLESYPLPEYETDLNPTTPPSVILQVTPEQEPAEAHPDIADNSGILTSEADVVFEEIPSQETSEADIEAEEMRRAQAEMVGRAQEGDMEALAQLWLMVEPSVKRLMRKMVGVNHAEDLTQSTAVKVLANINRFSPETKSGSFSSWTLTVAANLARDFFRKENRSGGTIDPTDEFCANLFQNAAFMAPPESPEDLYVQDESYGQLMGEVLDAIPPLFRETFTHIEIHEMPYEECAAFLGLKTGTVRSRLFRARQAVRAAVDDGKIGSDPVT